MRIKKIFLSTLLCLSIKAFASSFTEEGKINEIVMIHNVPSLCYLVYSTDGGIRVRKEDLDGNGEYLSLFEDYPEIELKSSFFKNENLGFETVEFLGSCIGKNYFFSLIFYFAKNEPLVSVVPVDENFNYVKTFVHDLQLCELFFIKENRLLSYKIDLETGMYELKSCSLKISLDRVYLYKDRWNDFYYGIGESCEQENVHVFAFSFDASGFNYTPLASDEIIQVKEFRNNDRRDLCLIRKDDIVFFSFAEDLNIFDKYFDETKLGFELDFLVDILNEENEYIFITYNENVLGNTSLVLQNESDFIINNNDLNLEGNVFVKGDLQKGGLKDFIFVKRIYEASKASNELYLYDFDSHCFIKRLCKNYENETYRSEDEDSFEIIYTFDVDGNKKSIFGLYGKHSCIDLFGEKDLRPEIMQFSKILNQIGFILLQNENEYTVINKRR